MTNVDPSRQLAVANVLDAAGPLTTPPASSIFQPTWDHYGPRLALVFGNHAAGGVCPYYVGTRCHHCDIGAGEGAAFDSDANIRRLQWFGQYYADQWPGLAHLVIYNSGSVLNRQEMPVEVLDEILKFAGGLPALRVLSLDSREPFIKTDVLVHIARRLPDTVVVRPILGLESSSDFIRNQLLAKQMPQVSIVRAYEAIAAAGVRLGSQRIGLDVNIVVAGPGTTSNTTVADAVETARLACQLGQEHNIAVDLNLHPYYPSARGRARFPNHDRCPLPVLFEATGAICELRRTLSSNGGIFIGWNDEAHDQEPDRRAIESVQAQQALDKFNRTQNPTCFDTSSIQRG